MMSKSCALCNGVVDRNGKYCQECNRSLIKGYDPKEIRKLASMPISTAQKRTCASCKILSVCLWTELMLEGCADPVRSMSSKSGKARMRVLGVV